MIHRYQVAQGIAIMNSARLTPVQRVALTASDCALMQAVKSLESELMDFMLNGTGQGTQAHLGKLEMVETFSKELVDRGYVNGRRTPSHPDFCDDPSGKQWESSDQEIGPSGDIKLSFVINVF